MLVVGAAEWRNNQSGSPDDRFNPCQPVQLLPSPLAPPDHSLQQARRAERGNLCRMPRLLKAVRLRLEPYADRETYKTVSRYRRAAPGYAGCSEDKD